MIQSLLLSSLVVLLLPSLYLYLVYMYKNPKVKRVLKVLYWGFIFALCIGLYIAIKNPFNTDFTLYPRSIGVYALCYFIAVNPLLFLTSTSLLGFFFYKFPRIRKGLMLVGVGLSLFSAFIILYGSFIGREKFQVKEVNYTHSQIPASFNGYKIVQLSDIHLGSWFDNPKPVQRIVDLVNAQNPDLIVFTGDLVNHKDDEMNPFMEVLSQLKAKDGVFSILGNHDYGPYYKHWKNPEDQQESFLRLQDKQRQMGWQLLNNEHVFLVNGSDSIALIGVENDGEPPFAQYGDLKKAAEHTEGYFRILLSHNPTHWRREVLPTTDIPLTLSGHTHGMQFQLGSFSLASQVYPEWGGMYTEGDQSLYVNIGIGSVGPPFRWGAWPEITVFTLFQE